MILCYLPIAQNTGLISEKSAEDVYACLYHGLECFL